MLAGVLARLDGQLPGDPRVIWDASRLGTDVAPLRTVHTHRERLAPLHRGGCDARWKHGADEVAFVR